MTESFKSLIEETEKFFDYVCVQDVKSVFIKKFKKVPHPGIEPGPPE